MAFRKVHTVVAVLGIALAGGCAWWWQNSANTNAKSPPMAASLQSGGVGASSAGPSAPKAGLGPGTGQSGPAPVEVAKVVATTITDDVQAVGAMRSRQGVMLRPEVSGRVASLGFIDGQGVKQGQLLVQLDDRLQQAQVQQALAQSSIAKTNLQRSRELLGQGFVSQSAVDQNISALQVADAQVALAQAQLARMQILAPFNAVAGIRLVNMGDYLKDGADVVDLQDLSTMAVDFRLPERYLSKVRVGLAVDVTVDALPGSGFKGRIEALDSQVDANGRSLLVRARVDNPKQQLKPGMFARPRVVFAVREGAVVVPEEALVPLGDKQYLYKLVDGEKGSKVALRIETKVGLRLPGKAEVQGVTPGDLVVVAGQGRLRGASTPVRVIDTPGAPIKPVAGAASAP